jgi:N-acetylglucosamine-6-sulfatase
VTRWHGLVLALLTLGAAAGLGTAHVAVAATARRRNVLFVLTDDLDTAELRFMPHTRALIGRQGATFDDYFVSNSLCCP